MSAGRALLLTERPEVGPRLLMALRWAGALGHPRPPVLVTPTPCADGELSGLLAAAGAHQRTLDRAAGVTAEGALRGLCRALAVRDILLWDSPRALALVPGLRDLPDRPRVSAHLAPAAAVPWDEAAHVAVRGRNAVDVHLVEEDATAARLERFELGPRLRRAAFPDAPARPAVGPDGPWTIVEGATWRRERGRAEALRARLVATGATAETIGVAALLEAIVVGAPPARVAFPDPDLPTAAPVLALAEAGGLVHVAGGAVEERLLAGGLARPLAEVVA